MHSNDIQDEQLVKAEMKINSAKEEFQENKWSFELKAYC